MAVYTKDEGQLLDWTELPDTVTDIPSYVAMGLVTKADELEENIVITVAHKDTNDAASNFVTVRVLGRMGADDEAWREIVALQAGGGQATSEALNANSGASQANPERIEVASTADWDTGLGEWLFLLDANVLVDSALVLVAGWSDNDYYINSWDLVRDYDAADSLFDGVDQFPVRVPAGYQYFKVVFYNSDNDATYAVRVDYAEVDSLT